MIGKLRECKADCVNRVLKSQNSKECDDQNLNNVTLHIQKNQTVKIILGIVNPIKNNFYFWKIFRPNKNTLPMILENENKNPEIYGWKGENTTGNHLNLDFQN